MKSLLSFVITGLVVAGCEKSAFFFAENQSEAALLLRYQERGGYVLVYELPPRTGSVAYAVSISGGATGWLEVLTEDCQQVAPDLTPAEFGDTVVIVARDGGVSAVQQAIDEPAPGLEEVFDRCQ